ncbi:lytic transglycosylase domain-containing protein [Mesorhizobium retamae]|uniref:lytic transglycosylase domain-containing protein n=1 Tax=Mesorhizobium retamae TaxID=2912854 RepID=UPI003CCFEA2B
MRCAVVVAIGALSVCTGSSIALAQYAPVGRLATADPYSAHVREASRRFGIPERWILAVLRDESAGDVRAISSAGAMGLMQVMPDTWAELRVRHRLGRNPYDPRDNILAGTAYLREMWDRYGDIAAMLAAYNAGPARFDQHRAKGRPLPAETRAYVAALAPVLRGKRPSKIALFSLPPPDWREATIFVVREDGAPAATFASPISVASQTPPTVQPEGLFITRHGDGNRP